MREADRMAGLVSHHTMELRVARVHSERLKIHGRPAGVDQQDVGAEVGPVAFVAGRVLCRPARYAHLGLGGGRHELHVGLLAPGVEVRQDAVPEGAVGGVYEAHREVYATPAPVAGHVESESFALVPLWHLLVLEARRSVVGILLDRVGRGTGPLGARQVPRRTRNCMRIQHEGPL